MTHTPTTPSTFDSGQPRKVLGRRALNAAKIRSQPGVVVIALVLLSMLMVRGG